MARLTISGLHKSYGKVPALRGIDLSIREGEDLTARFVVGADLEGCDALDGDLDSMPGHGVGHGATDPPPPSL
jgi:hypothetical protein